MSKFTVNWECEDGYIGGARPQTLQLDVDDMVESCDTEEDAVKYLEDEVRSDFDSKITFHVKNHDEVMEEWRARKKSAPATDDES